MSVGNADAKPTFRELSMNGWKPRRLSLAERIIWGVTEIDEAGWMLARSPSERLRKLVLHRDGHRCVVCRSRSDLQADHFVSWADGGVTTFDNLLTLCGTCNRHKSDLSGWPGLERAHRAFRRSPMRMLLAG